MNHYAHTFIKRDAQVNSKDNKSIRVSVVIPKRLLRLVDQSAQKEDRSRAAEVRRRLEESFRSAARPAG